MQNKDFEIEDILEKLELESEKKINNIIEDSTNIKEKLFERIKNKNQINSDDYYDDNSINKLLLENINNKKNILKLFKINPKILFITKYLLTTFLIFFVLLLTTNYRAYLNIVNSYVYKEEFENKSKKLISSVQASSINEKYKNNIDIKKAIIEKDKERIISKYSIKNLVNSSDNEKLNMDIEITPYENRIVIPKIWKNIPLIDIKNRKISWKKELNNIFMKELEKWVVRYPSSAKPWEDWNTFIFWHSSNFPWIKWNYNDVFSLIDKVVYDDEIIIYYNQRKIRYRIKEKKVISPWDLSILKWKSDKSELTLMTCWPIWTTLNRLIITWEIIEES